MKPAANVCCWLMHDHRFSRLNNVGGPTSSKEAAALSASTKGRSLNRSGVPKQSGRWARRQIMVQIMVQKLRVPLGFVLAAGVLYFAEPTRTSILLGLPVATAGGLFRALAAGVIKKD